MPLSITQGERPANAGWKAKAKLWPDGEVETWPVADTEGELGFETPSQDVEIAWYGDDRIKLTLPSYTPAVIRQAYLTGDGRDLIIEIARRDR